MNVLTSPVPVSNNIINKKLICNNCHNQDTSLFRQIMAPDHGHGSPTGGIWKFS